MYTFHEQLETEIINGKHRVRVAMSVEGEQYRTFFCVFDHEPTNGEILEAADEYITAHNESNPQ